MKDPIKILLEEHKLLFQAIEATKELQKISDNKKYHDLSREMILFFRNFSETYHHPKEDDFLYPLLRGRSQELSPEFLHLISDNHEDFKGIMASIENAYVDHNYQDMRLLMDKYIHLMEEHIRNENKVILSVAGKLLKGEEANSMALSFERLDDKHGDKNELAQNLYKINSQLL